MNNANIKPQDSSREEWITPEVESMHVSTNTLAIPDPNSGDPSTPD